ncbi:unnamed protein product [Rhizoctonia solani]|uniref:Non-specific protein-tyrosine kinase n=1 Tax=Rhizoctonia solani TaxID=456999 RepID=A0A8H3E2V9_9AGAM|nr:unnamed protein product [Rhizoctonia solani]
MALHDPSEPKCLCNFIVSNLSIGQNEPRVDLSPQMDAEQDTAMIMSGGGFGDIWKGKLHDGSIVAIKAWRANVLGQCDPKTLKRAAREIYYWSKMQHINIHQLQGVILFKGQYLGMVSDWMENGNLHEYLRKRPDIDRYQLCIHVASGLEYMHSCSVVHGDLKAINVLVSSDGIAMLSDFDFSVMSEVSSLVFSESSNSRSGSIRWASPEILLEEVRNRTTQADVYALGMTILEIFTGDVPYPDCRTDIGVIRTVERGTLPTRPIQLGGNEKGDMMWHLMVRCWSRDASARPSSAEVVNAISPTSLPVSSSLVASVGSQQSHSQSSSRTIRVTTGNDAQNDARTTATSPPLESVPETNNASTSSNIRPIRRDRNRYACGECDKKFPQERRLSNHIQRYHRGQPNAYLCDTPLCGRSFASEDGLTSSQKMQLGKRN